MSDERFTEDELQAIWMEFQRDRRATCPYDGAELELELRQDAPRPQLRVRCPKGGRSGVFSPPDSAEVQAWAE